MLYVPASPISSARRLFMPPVSASCRTFSNIPTRVEFSPQALSLSDAGSVMPRPRQDCGAPSGLTGSAEPAVPKSGIAQQIMATTSSRIFMIFEPLHGLFQRAFNRRLRQSQFTDRFGRIVVHHVFSHFHTFQWNPRRAVRD